MSKKSKQGKTKQDEIEQYKTKQDKTKGEGKMLKRAMKLSQALREKSSRSAYSPARRMRLRARQVVRAFYRARKAIVLSNHALTPPKAATEQSEQE